VHWYGTYGNLGDGALTRWARQQPEPLAAWNSCPRADWLLRALLELHSRRDLELDRQVLAGLVHACVERTLGDAPEFEALGILQAWSRGEARLPQVYEAEAQLRVHHDEQSAYMLAWRALYIVHDEHQAVEVTRLVVERLASTRTAQRRVWAELADLVRAQRWPLKKAPLVRGSRPSFWVAWDLAIAQGVATELTTVGLLLSHELRLGLKRAAPELSVREGEILRAVSQQIAARPDWQSVQRSVLEVLSAP
jgi:hypothetical protein